VNPSGVRETLVLPPENPCFVIRSVAWQELAPPSILVRKSKQIVGHCVGAKGLRVVQRYLIDQLKAAGQPTARIFISEQSLANGTLTLRYVPGRIARIEDKAAIGLWQTVLPMRSGEMLHQYDLDQALENIRRLSSQSDATLEIEPGEHAGQSNLLIKPGTGKRWHGYLGGDNAGLKAAGQYQVQAGLTLDSPFFLYDQLTVAWAGNARGRRTDAYVQAASANYNVPWGYGSFMLSASKAATQQTLAGFNAPIRYRGMIKKFEAGVTGVPYRGSTYKGYASFWLTRESTSSMLNDVAIGVQRRDVTGYRVKVGHRHFIGHAMLDMGVGIKDTLPGLSPVVGFVYGAPGWNGHSRILSASMDVTFPFQLGSQQLLYQGHGEVQHAKSPIALLDAFMMGGQHSVRGFDGEMALASEGGWRVRNDVSLSLAALGATNQQLYTGLDIGRVTGASARYFSGRMLMGAVAGIKGHFNVLRVKLSYDVSVGWPLKKPSFFQTARPVVVAAVMTEF
jgi:hemolysin activation/secretion protein